VKEEAGWRAADSSVLSGRKPHHAGAGSRDLPMAGTIFPMPRMDTIRPTHRGISTSYMLIYNASGLCVLRTGLSVSGLRMPADIHIAVSFGLKSP